MMVLDLSYMLARSKTDNCTGMAQALQCRLMCRRKEIQEEQERALCAGGDLCHPAQHAAGDGVRVPGAASPELRLLRLCSGQVVSAGGRQPFLEGCAFHFFIHTDV